jgi:hypothetical protein
VSWVQSPEFRGKKKKDPRYNPFLKASSYVIKERSI